MALPVDGSPSSSYKEVTVKWANLGRLLLFIYLENQRNDADDQNAELKQVGISDHDITPLRCSGGGSKKCGLLPKEGPPPTAYWQRQRISMRQGHYSIICRIWQARILQSSPAAMPAPFDKGA